MPRSPRIDYPGARHHVMNRGPGHRNLFHRDEDCERFLSLLEEAVEQFGVKIAAYVLMPNHYHLLVESVRGNLSEAMKSVAQGYSQYINSAPGSDGSVFRDRFASKLVLEEAHWHHLPVYMHLNPREARLVMKPSQWQWSSRDVYARKGGGLRVPWLDNTGLLSQYGGPAGYRKVEDDVIKGRKTAPSEFHLVLFEGRHKRVQVEKQDSVGTGLTPAQALGDVIELTGATHKSLLETRMGPSGNAPRALAVWWLIYGAGCSNLETARALKMSETAVSKTLARWKGHDKLFRNKRLLKWQEQLQLKGK